MKAILKGSPKLVAILIAIVVAAGLTIYGCAAAPQEEDAASTGDTQTASQLGSSPSVLDLLQGRGSGNSSSTTNSSPSTTNGSSSGAQNSAAQDPAQDASSQASAGDTGSVTPQEDPTQEIAQEPQSEPQPEVSQEVVVDQGAQESQEWQAPPEEAYVDPVVVEEATQENISNETAALEASTPAMPVDFQVTAPGIAVEANDRATVDYSNAADGYVMVCYTAPTSNRIKVLVNGPTTQYQYNINAGDWVALPLSDGSGGYRIGVYENVQGSSYAEALTAYVEANLKDEYAPFLRSNQYVNIAGAPAAVARAQEICGAEPAALKKVQLVYDYVVNNLSYDYNKAATVQSGYVPNLDEVLNSRMGICFDYAALMTGMLRSQGVPCKLVIGYAGDTYHAWIDVWSQDNGWVSGAIYFDGNTWQRMDPTFASSSGSSEDVMQFIGDGQNYAAKYFY